MDSVRDRGDLVTDSHPCKQATAHLAVQLGDSVGSAGYTQDEGSHVEMAVISRVVSQCHEILDRHAPSVGPRLEIGLDQIAVEAVDPRRHRVCVVNTRPGRIRSMAVGMSPPSITPVDQLQGDETGVSLIEVVYRGDPPDRSQARAPPTPSTISWSSR